MAMPRARASVMVYWVYPKARPIRMAMPRTRFWDISVHGLKTKGRLRADCPYMAEPQSQSLNAGGSPTDAGGAPPMSLVRSLRAKPEIKSKTEYETNKPKPKPNKSKPKRSLCLSVSSSLSHMFNLAVPRLARDWTKQLRHCCRPPKAPASRDSPDNISRALRSYPLLTSSVICLLLSSFCSVFCFHFVFMSVSFSFDRWP